MGYYSHVKIVAEKAAFNRLKETILRYDWKPEIREEEDYGVITFDEIKWYESFPEIQDVINLMKFLSGINEEGFGFKMIDLGEDNAVNMDYNQRGLERFPDFDVMCYIDNSY